MPALAGFSEAIACVRNAPGHAATLCEIGGWEILWQGPSDPALLAAWGLESTVTGQEILLHNPGDDRGFLRLLQLSGCAQQLIRPNPQTWDSGGIIDLNVRVLDLQDKYQALLKAGWYGISEPVRWQFGPTEVCEWIALHSDGLAIAIIERLAPPLEGWPTLRRFSRVFNSSQVVVDMPRSLSFYRDLLGFEIILHQRSPLRDDAGENVLGIPHNMAASIEVEIAILQGRGDMDGSVELVCFHGLSGRDFSARAKPPNLGVLGLRFPTDDLEKVVQHLRSSGIDPAVDTTAVKMEPFGPVRLIAVQAPEGAWLEFYQSAP